MIIKAKKKRRCAYPPIGKYGFPKPADKLPQINSIDLSGVKLRPDGARQPTSEANIMGRLKAVAERRASPGCIENRV